MPGQKKRIQEKNKRAAWRELHMDARRAFLGELRQARLSTQKDAEDFDDLLFVFERLGCYRLSEAATLGSYQESLLALASQSGLGQKLSAIQADWHSSAGILYQLVNEGRNDALHMGARARHLTEHTIELCLILEDAIMNGDQPMTKIGDIMVRTPVTAEEWHPVSYVRQIMLTNSFSYLPICRAGEWKLISDYRLAAFLRRQIGEPPLDRNQVHPAGARADLSQCVVIL
jgi:hypothetical protein